MTIDQDGLDLNPIVWYDSGEIVGNYVQISIREQNPYTYTWFVHISTTLDKELSQTGIAPSFHEARVAINNSVVAFLNENYICPKMAEDYKSGWYTDIYENVRCFNCDTLYNLKDGLWVKVCTCGDNDQ